MQHLSSARSTGQLGHGLGRRTAGHSAIGPCHHRRPSALTKAQSTFTALPMILLPAMPLMAASASLRVPNSISAYLQQA